MTMLVEKAALKGNEVTQASPEDLASFVKRLGNPVSTILLDSECSIFRIPQIDGIIGYQLIKSSAVVIGDPICLPEDREALMKAFHQHCKKRNQRVIYFLVSDSFARWAIDNGCQTLIQVGEELVVDPSKFKKKQKLRWKVKQSILHGVTVKEYKTFDFSLESRMKQTVDSWLKTKNGPQIHLGNLDFSLSNDDKRIFYAEKDNQIVGLLKISPVDRFEGWSLHYFLASSDSPVGTTENLMTFVFDTLASENCHFLCLGAISGSHIGEIIGMNIVSKYITFAILKLARWIFKLDARKIYLSKYHPQEFPTYCLFSEQLTLMDLLALKQILNVRLCFQ